MRRACAVYGLLRGCMAKVTIPTARLTSVGCTGARKLVAPSLSEICYDISDMRDLTLKVLKRAKAVGAGVSTHP